MIAELSHYALLLAMAVAAIQAAAGLALLNPLAAANPGIGALTSVARRASALQALLVTGAFFGLIALFVRSDFSVLTVIQNSHSAKPLLYRIAGAWGNHEGSLLLWVTVLALFGAAVAMAIRDHGAAAINRLRAVTLGIHGLLGAGFLGLLVFTSNPFSRVLEAPLDGQDLNPLLQDPALALHPPMLYLGYVGFSSAYAFAIAGLLTGQLGRDWAVAAGRYVLVAWAALTLGIALGSWWAYYELGWGGWWFWDPVENASLMPWLAGTALLHSSHVMAKREAMAGWTVLLSILTFSLSLLGTFLVRSGVLTSVHAFAMDPERGLFILMLIGAATLGALGLYGWRISRADALPQAPAFAAISREGALILNNLLLATACAVVLLGTLYPLVLTLLGLAPVSVGPPYFEATVLPLLAPLLLAIGVAPFLAWRRQIWSRGLLLRLAGIAGVAALIAILISLEAPARSSAMALFGLAAGVWMLGTSLLQWLERGRYRLISCLTLPAWQQGMTIAHIGAAVAVLGMAGSALWSVEDILRLEPGERTELAGYKLKFDGIREIRGPNYTANEARIEAISPPGWLSGQPQLVTLTPAKRWYPVAGMRTTEAAIHFDGWGNLYVTLGQPDEQAPGSITGTDVQGWSLHLQYHPLLGMVWIGAALMALGGLTASADRLFRARTQRAAVPVETREETPAALAGGIG
jgi:cytochrome c-type biogenesis protein CcmF